MFPCPCQQPREFRSLKLCDKRFNKRSFSEIIPPPFLLAKDRMPRRCPVIRIISEDFGTNLIESSKSLNEDKKNVPVDEAQLQDWDQPQQKPPTLNIVSVLRHNR